MDIIAEKEIIEKNFSLYFDVQEKIGRVYLFMEFLVLNGEPFFLLASFLWTRRKINFLCVYQSAIFQVDEKEQSEKKIKNEGKMCVKGFFLTCFKSQWPIKVWCFENGQFPRTPTK